MVTILIAGEGEEKDLYSALDFALSKYFGQGQLAISDINSYKPTKNDNVIVLYKRPQPSVASLEGARAAIAVVDSGNEQLIAHVSKTRLLAITCGLRSRDTITLSSIDPESAVIDLRRTITCLDGSEVEPQEIPLRYNLPKDNFLLMCIAAILILSGKIESLKEGFI